MKTPASDYIAAAMAVAEPTEAPEVAAPVPEPVADPAPVPEPVADPGADPAKLVEPAKTPEPVKPPDRVAKGFEDLARERAAFRAEKERAKAETITPEDRALLAAAKSGSALSLMAAAKIPWSQAAQEVLDGKLPAKKTDEPEPDAQSQRIAALEQEIATRKAQETRAIVMSNLQALTKAEPEKYRLTAGLGEEKMAIAYIENHYQRYGELPGSDLEESMQIALEAVESHLAKEKQRWEKLTGSSGVVTSPVSKPVVPAAGAVSQQAPKTLTNGTGAGPSQAPTASKKAKTSDEYIAAAIEAATAQ